MILAIIAGICIYKFIFGDPANFIGGDPENQPVQGGARQYLGIIYHGGFVVPILLSLVIMTIAFSIERYLTLSKARSEAPTAELQSLMRRSYASFCLKKTQQHIYVSQIQ